MGGYRYKDQGFYYGEYKYFSGGGYGYTHESLVYENNNSIFSFGLNIEFALLKFLSIETGFGYGWAGESKGLFIPLISKWGGKFTKMELTYNIGYSFGMGFTTGLTFGFHAGPGIIFLDGYGVFSFSKSKRNILGWNLFLGYKVGLGNKKLR